MKKYVQFIFTSAIFWLLMNFGTVATASENHSFSVTPLDPTTGEVQNSYYDLLVKPNQEIKVMLRINNSASEEITVAASANNGATNNNGITSYLGNEKRDETLVTAFSDLASLSEEEVKIAGNSSQTITVSIKAPSDSFDGEILGGIRIYQKQNPSEEQQEETSTVNTDVAYTIGVVLRENNQEVIPDMNLLSVQTELRNYRNYISATLQNAAPTIINELIAEAKVYKKGSTEVTYQVSNDQMRMAPHSQFNFGISLEDQALEVGEYKMVVTGSANGYPFSFEKEFTISREDAKAGNRNAVFVTKQTNYMWLYILLATVCCLTVLLLVVIVLKCKQKID